MTHRGSRNQQAARGGVFPTQTKRAVGLGEPAGAGLPEKPGQKAAGPSPAHSRPMLLPGRCPIHRAAASPPAPWAAGPSMLETPGAAALETLLRHLHPGLAGRNRACSTSLWTHIRSLVHKGKVGLREAGDPWGGRHRAPSPALSPCWLCWSQFWKRRGGMGRRARGSPASGGNRKGRLSVALSPRLKLPVGMPRRVQWFRHHASLQRARLRSSARN